MTKTFTPWSKRLALIGIGLAMSACSFVGPDAGTPAQRLEASAVHAYVTDIGPLSQRYVLLNASYRPRMYGMNPYFGHD